jgi:hypothetical protein
MEKSSQLHDFDALPPGEDSLEVVKDNKVHNPLIQIQKETKSKIVLEFRDYIYEFCNFAILHP